MTINCAITRNMYLGYYTICTQKFTFFQELSNSDLDQFCGMARILYKCWNCHDPACTILTAFLKVALIPNLRHVKSRSACYIYIKTVLLLTFHLHVSGSRNEPFTPALFTHLFLCGRGDDFENRWALPRRREMIVIVKEKSPLFLFWNGLWRALCGIFGSLRRDYGESESFSGSWHC